MISDATATEGSIVSPAQKAKRVDEPVVVVMSVEGYDRTLSLTHPGNFVTVRIADGGAWEFESFIGRKEATRAADDA